MFVATKKYEIRLEIRKTTDHQAKIVEYHLL
jgi:hypothetical protein